MRSISNVVVGDADVDPAAPSHVRGVREGNEKGSTRRARGIEPRGPRAEGTARRSTGINPRDRDPIDPRMPNLSPP